MKKFTVLVTLLLVLTTGSVFAAGPYYQNANRYPVEIPTRGGVSMTLQPGQIVEGSYYAKLAAQGVLTLYSGPTPSSIVYSYAEPEVQGINDMLPSQVSKNNSLLSSNSGVATWTDNLKFDYLTDTLNIQTTQNFDPTLGTDLLTNGEFATALTGWTAGAGWAWSAGTAAHTSGTATLEQPVTIASDGVYIVSLDVQDRTVGNVAITIGGVLFSTEYSYNGVGDFYGYLTAGTASLVLTPTTTYNGKIKVISLKLMTPNNKFSYSITEGSNSFGIKNHFSTFPPFYEEESSIVIGSPTTAQYLYLGSEYYGGDGSVVLGQGAFSMATRGAGSVVIGAYAAKNVLYSVNSTFIGYGAAYGLYLSYTDNKNASSRQDVVIGSGAGWFLSSSSYNVLIGSEAGSYSGNPISSGNALTTGTGNTFVGYRSGLGSSTQTSNSTVLGYGAYVTASNTVVLGNENVTDVLAGSVGQAKVTATGVKLLTGSKPACDSTKRGTVWYVAGGAGVADTLEACRKDNLDSYAWVSVY